MAQDKKVYMTLPASPSMAKAIRAKCIDCSETTSDVRDCHICHCPLWPYRFGAGPEAAINYLQKHYTVVLIENGKYKYIEQTKGKRLKRAKVIQNAPNAMEEEDSVMDDKDYL